MPMFVTSELTQLASEATSLWVKRLLNVLPICQHRSIPERPEPTVAVSWASIYEQGFIHFMRSNRQNCSHTKSLILSHKPSRAYVVFILQLRRCGREPGGETSVHPPLVCSWYPAAVATSCDQHLFFIPSLCKSHKTIAHRSRVKKPPAPWNNLVTTPRVVIKDRKKAIVFSPSIHFLLLLP